MRTTDFVILGLLSHSDLTGYEMKKLVDLRFRFFWSESFGQIFPALKSLAERGLVEELVADGGGKRPAKSYRINAAGRAELSRWLALPVEKESLRLEILLKMYFSHHVSEEVMLGHIEQFVSAHQQDLAVLRGFQKELVKLPVGDPDHPNILRVIDFGVRVNEAYLAWSQETTRFLEERKKRK